MILTIITILTIHIAGLVIGYQYGRFRSEVEVLSCTELDDRLAPYEPYNCNDITTASGSNNVTWSFTEHYHGGQ